MMNNSQGASSFFSGLSTLLGHPHPLLHNLSDTTARRLKELERENGRLKRAVANLTLDKLILEEAAKGNF